MPEWTTAEDNALERYFTSNWSEMTLFQRLTDIRSDRSYEAMTRKLRRMRERGWIKKRDVAIKKLRVGHLDIEATHLKANFGYILTWYIKHDGRNEYEFSCIKSSELHTGYRCDKRVIAELLAALKKFDVIWTHWGADRRFDMPYIRTRAFINGLQNDLPLPGTMYLKDTWPIARNKLALHRNSLEAIAMALQVKNVKKTVLDPERWISAAQGDPKALEYILLHNKRDVQLLERVVKKLEPLTRLPMTSV
jgi:uncharacterized protein YprB with RNaseH-like and TPR domain